MHYDDDGSAPKRENRIWWVILLALLFVFSVGFVRMLQELKHEWNRPQVHVIQGEATSHSDREVARPLPSAVPTPVIPSVEDVITILRKEMDAPVVTAEVTVTHAPSLRAPRPLVPGDKLTIDANGNAVIDPPATPDTSSFPVHPETGEILVGDEPSMARRARRHHHVRHWRVKPGNQDCNTDPACPFLKGAAQGARMIP